jgi:pilus assembly protein CpaF
LVEQVVAPLGRRVDPASPVVDARLADGSRVHVVVPPLAVDGPCVTIRRFAARAVALEDMAPPGTAALLRWAVKARANLVVSGGTGSGKTTLLNALGREVAAGERIVTVEDAAELRLPSDHVVRLESRPASAEGTGEVSCRELLRNALRMRPDRLVVGEVRGAEAFDLLQAMNTGHDGSLSTVHANGAAEAIGRLETLALLAGVGLTQETVRDHLAVALDLVVHVSRGADGTRRVTEVIEVPGPAAGRGSVPPPRARLLADGGGLQATAQRGGREPSAGPPPSPVTAAPDGLQRWAA